MFVVELLHKSELKGGNWSTSNNVLSVARLVMAAKFYNGKHRLWKYVAAEGALSFIYDDKKLREEIVREHTRCLEMDMRKWLQGAQFPDGLTHEEYNGGHPVEFWQDHVNEHLHLAKFAQWL